MFRILLGGGMFCIILWWFFFFGKVNKGIICWYLLCFFGYFVIVFFLLFVWVYICLGGKICFFFKSYSMEGDRKRRSWELDGSENWSVLNWFVFCCWWWVMGLKCFCLNVELRLVLIWLYDSWVSWSWWVLGSEK